MKKGLINNPKGTGGKRFQKGVSGNPGGKRKVSLEIQTVQETTYKDFITKLQKYGSLSKGELSATLEDESIPSFDLVFIRIIYDAMEGKSDARQVLIDRLWGKVGQIADFNFQIKEDPERAKLRNMSLDELVETAKKIMITQ